MSLINPSEEGILADGHYGSGPNAAQVDYNEVGKGRVAAEYTNPGECYTGVEQ